MNPNPVPAADQEVYDEADRLVILTPCYGGLVTTLFRDSLDVVLHTAPRANFRCPDGKIRSLTIVAQAINYPGDSHIDRARNNILHDFLSTHYRHALFCDGDQTFEPQDIVLTWCRLMMGVRVIGGTVALKAIKSTFAFNTIGAPTVDPVTKLLNARDTGTGWLAFKRDVLDQIRTEWPALVRRKLAAAIHRPEDDAHVDRAVAALASLGYSADLSYKCPPGTARAGQTLHAFFASGVTYRDGMSDWLSEDWLFCHRCLQLGIEIKVDPMIRIKHLGPYLFPPPPDDLVGATLQVTSGERPPFNPVLAKAANAALQALHDDIHDQSITILHATRRPEQALRIRQLWIDRAKDKNFEYVFGIDEDDSASSSAFQVSGFRYQVSAGPGGGIVRAINEAARVSTGRILIMAADDCEPPQDWDIQIRESLKGRLHEPLLLWTSDGYTDQPVCTHPIMTRALYEQQGYFFCPEYPHLFCDTELTERAVAAGQVVDGRHIVLKHQHPMFTQAKPDALHLERNSPEAVAVGRAIFKRRNPQSKHAHL